MCLLLGKMKEKINNKRINKINNKEEMKKCEITSEKKTSPITVVKGKGSQKNDGG